MKKSLLIKSLLAVSMARLSQAPATPSTAPQPQPARSSLPTWLEPLSLDE